MFSGRIIDIFVSESIYRRIFGLELSKNLLFFSQVNAEVHFHKKAPMARVHCSSRRCRPYGWTSSKKQRAFAGWTG